MTPFIGNRAAEEVVEILAPGNGNGRRSQGVFEHQCPADGPGDDLAHRAISIGVGAACDGNHRRELGITKAGKGATERRKDEREGDRWSGGIPRRGRRSDKETRADDGSDAQGDEVFGVECTLERTFAGLRQLSE
jgi:hypothetical protein